MQLFQWRNHIFAHQVSKDGVQPSDSNLEEIVECMLPQAHTEVMPFLAWWTTTGGLSKGLHALHSHSVNIWLEKGPAGSQNGCLLQKMPWRLSKHWSRHLWQPPFWLLLTTLNHSCWRLMCPRMDWGQCCHRCMQMGGTTLSPMAAEPLHLMKRTTTQLRSNF